MRAAHRLTLAAGGILLAALTTAPAAWAHLEGTLAAGWMSGLIHPLSGFDHLLAMVAVGLWAAQRSGAERWRLPLTFVGAMVIGGGIAMAGFTLPALELGVAVSMLLLGGLVFAAPMLTARLAMGLIALAALVHGQAHGSELVAGAAPATYALGFAVTTLALHTIGVALGSALLRSNAASAFSMLRVGGAAIAVGGLALLSVSP